MSWTGGGLGPTVSYTGSMSSPTDFFLHAFLRNKAVPTTHSVVAMTLLVVAIVVVELTIVVEPVVPAS